MGDNKHPCLTPTLVLNHSPINQLVALLYRLLIEYTRSWLILYFFFVTHCAACHTPWYAFLKSMKTWIGVVGGALLYIPLIEHTRSWLILYFFLVAHSAACHTPSYTFLKSLKTWYRRCWWCTYFSHSTLRLNICSPVFLPACSSAIITTTCGLSLFRMTFSITLLGWQIRLMVR